MNLLGLIFDGGLAVLLIVTISYCSRLSRRIRLLQDSRSELAGMITQFDEATNRAMHSLGELQTVSKRITDALQLKIEKANFLADDLAFLIEKSTKLSAELDKLQAKQPAVAAPKPPSPTISEPFSPSPAKPKLAAYHPPQTSPNDIPPSIKSASSLEALLGRLASSVSSSPSATKPVVSENEPSGGLRTEAERELLKALKSGR